MKVVIVFGGSTGPITFGLGCGAKIFLCCKVVMIYMVTKRGLCRACPGGVDHRKDNRRLLTKRLVPQIIAPIATVLLFLFRFRCMINCFIGNNLFVFVMSSVLLLSAYFFNLQGEWR